MSKVILIDNGHGKNTKGKCSPDKRLMEWQWTRRVAAMVCEKLMKKGIDARLLVPEETDISLTERVRRANVVCRQHGASNVALVSVHVNAAGADGKWHDARGFSVWVARTCSENSKKLAQLMYAEAEKRNLKGNRSVPKEKYFKGNRSVPKEKYWQADFAMVKNTNCPAVLTENLFQDNKEDVDYLLTVEGQETIADLHVEAIMKYLKP